MFNWLKELLELRSDNLERRIRLTHEDKICQSCETLRQQLEIANYEKQELLKRILKEPEPVVQGKNLEEVSRPKTISWRLRQQMLEREDREAARAMKNAAQPDTKSTEDLEKDLDIASAEREAERS